MKNYYFILTLLFTITIRVFGQNAPIIEVDIPVPVYACNIGDCTNLTANYPPVKQTTGYSVSSIAYLPPFTFIGGIEIPATNDDIWEQFNLPFSFCFYGNYYDKVLVGSNGLLSFDFLTNVPDVNGQCEWNFDFGIPNPAFPELNAIYGVYQDTDISLGAIGSDAVPDNIQKVNYFLFDTGPNAAPNRKFVASWNELPQFLCNSSAGLQTSQIILYESTNIIDVYVHKRTPCLSWNGGPAIIGVQNEAGTNAVVPPGRNYGTWSATDEAWRFTPTGVNSPTSIKWYKDNVFIPGSTNVNPLNVCPTGPTTYTAEVSYTRCDNSVVSATKDITIDLATPLPNGVTHDILICNPPTSPYTVDINENPDLLNGIANPSDYIISYYEDINDATNGASNNINYFSDADLTTFSFPTFPKTIYIRIEGVSTGCITVRQFVIDSVAAPGGTISYGAGPYCDTDSVTVTPTGLTSGGTYAATPAGLNLNSTTGAISPGSTVGNYQVVYSILATPTCPAYSTPPANVVIQSCVCTVTASTNSVTICEDTPLTPITYSLTGTATGASVAGTLPAGVTINPFGTGYAVSGTPTTPGVYNFTVTLTTATGSCVAPPTTITVNTQPNAGTAVAAFPTVCDNSTTPIDLFSLITGEQTGGTWTRTGGSNGVFNAAAGTFTPGPAATTSSFKYTVTGLPCSASTSDVTININPQPVAGTDGPAAAICDNSTTLINLSTLITGEQPGGTWTRTGGTGGLFNAAAGTFTPAPGATTSTFDYKVTGTAPCGFAQNTATVNISPAPNAGTAVIASPTVCDNSATPIDLFSLITGEQTGGTWTRTAGNNGIFNAAAGTFTPAAGATTSSFQYEVTGSFPCSPATSNVTININPQPIAGTDGPAATICDNSTTLINLSTLITGEQPGGTWTRTGGSGGLFNAASGTFTPAPGATTSTFDYKVTGTTPCGFVQNTATVNISPAPNAGTAVIASPTVCDNSATPIDLFSLITGEQTGGTWTRTAGNNGIFNAAAGTFTPAAGATTSSFQYEVTGSFPCSPAISNVTININPQPVAGTDGPAAAICDNSTTLINLSTLITGEQPGGTWTRTGGSGGLFNAAGGTFTPAPGATTSTFDYKVTGAAPCGFVQNTATVNISPAPNAGSPILTTPTVCDSSTTSIDLFSLITGEQTGGTWTRTAGNNGIFNAAAGTFTPAPGATTSSFQYEVTGSFPCSPATSNVTININPQPIAGTDGPAATICDNSTTLINLSTLITGEQPGGTWTRTGGTGGLFDPLNGTFTPASGATTSTFTYKVTGAAPCGFVQNTATVNINPAPNAGSSDGIVICDTSNTTINLFDIITGEQLGGTWTRNAGGTGGVFNAVAGTFSPVGATSSSFTYTLTGTLPCSSPSSVATVTIEHQPNAGISNPAIVVCEDSNTSIDLFNLISSEEPGGVWSRDTGTGGAFVAATGTFTPALGATSSTFTYTLPGTVACAISTSTASVNINPKPDAGLDNNTTTVCDSDNSTISLFNLIGGTPQAGGTWTRNAGGTGGNFNAANGTFTALPGATTSTFTYKVTGVLPCNDDTSLITININPKRNAGIPNSPTAICDTSNTPIDLFSLITGEEAGGSWTRMTGTGGTFDPVAGTFIPFGATSSKFKYRLTGAAPCGSPESEGTITVFPQPIAGSDGNRTICETDTAVINLFDVITGEQPGGTWTRTSGTGGTFNAIAGTFTPNIGATLSTFKYNIFAAPPCLDDSSFATIAINPSVTIVLTSGNGNQTLCINSPFQTSVYTVGNGATGVSLTGGLPTGVIGVFDPNTGKFTISGTPTISGPFSYTLEALGTCPGTPISGQIIVNPRVTMILDSAAGAAFQTPCKGTAIIPIKYLVGNGATGAVASGLPPGLITGFNPLANIFTISGTVNTVGVYNFSVHTTGGCGPDVILTGTIEVIQNATIALNSAVGTEHQTICINDQIVNITYQVDNGATGASIVSGMVPTGIQGVFSGGAFIISGTPTQAGDFSFTVTTSGGCSTASMVGRIIVNPLPVVAIDGGYICVDENGNPKPGSTFILDTRLHGDYTFVWSDENGVINGQNGSTYEAIAPGVYSLQVTNNITHCSNSTSVTVVPSYPPVKVTANATSYFADDQQIAVSVAPPGNYEYQLDNGAFQDSSQFVGFNSGYHTITVRDKFMCGTRSTIILILDFPRFFTPNGDGFNDTWNVEDLKYIDESATIYIFDRYGKLVKEIGPKGDGWDGTMNNKILPASDYWFKILYLDKGVDKEFKSHFSLKR